jgi:hypothetical protein
MALDWLGLKIVRNVGPKLPIREPKQSVDIFIWVTVKVDHVTTAVLPTQIDKAMRICWGGGYLRPHPVVSRARLLVNRGR